MSTGIYVPENKVWNEDLAQLGCDSEWIIQRTGIECRHHVAPGQASSDMATRAGQACLERAGVSPEQVDLILVATMTPDHYAPSTACLTQAKLGCPNAAAMDINAACSGFVYSLMVAGNFIRSGNSQNALVIGSETLTMVMDPEDKKTFPLFGDAAAGVLVQADPNPDGENASGILAYRMASVGELGDCLIIPGGGSLKPCSQEVVDNRD